MKHHTKFKNSKSKNELGNQQTNRTDELNHTSNRLGSSSSQIDNSINGNYESFVQSYGALAKVKMAIDTIYLRNSFYKLG